MRSLLCFSESFCPPGHELRRDSGQYVFLLDDGIPCGQISHFGIFAHVLSIGTHYSPAECLAALAVLADKLTCDDSACRETFQVPFPRPWNRLVEIVDAEDEVAFGRGEDAEVRHVHVAAKLNLQATDRRWAEVLSHDRRSAAQKGKGRRQHSSVSHGNQFMESGPGLRFKNFDRILSVWQRFVFRQAGPGHSCAQALTSFHAIGDGRAGRGKAINQFPADCQIFGS